MSKYNLSELLTEVAGGRIGTLNISARDLINKMEDLEDKGVKVNRYDGLSADGKTYVEFHVHPMRKYDEDSSFSVYDFKFGFDPMSEDHFMEEYPFSIGGRSAALDSAETVLRSGDVGYEVSESISEEKNGMKLSKKNYADYHKDNKKKVDELSMGKKDKDDDGESKFRSAQYGIGDAFVDAVKKRMQKEMTLPNPIMRDGFEGDNYQEKETERMRRDGSSGESQKSMASVPFYQRDVRYDDDFFIDELNDGELDESFASLAKKIDKQKGKSKKDAANIAGYIANIKRKGGGSGPTAKQKARMKEEDINEAPGSTINLSQDDMDKLHSDGKLDIDGYKVIYKMNENGHVDDYADEIKEVANPEVMALLDKIRKHLKGSDRNFQDKEIEAYIESLNREIKRGEFDGVESASMEDHEEDLSNYIADRSLEEHFKRFR